MLNEQTHQKLVAMKLYAMAAAFQEHLDKIDDAQLCFEERFGLMVDREWIERDRRRVNRRLHRAKLREQACVENRGGPQGVDKRGDVVSEIFCGRISTEGGAEDEEEETQPFIGVQSKGGPGGIEGGQDAGRACRTV